MNNKVSLKNIINTEFLKLRKSKVLWCIPICLIPDILVFSMYAVNEKYPCVVWDGYLTMTISLLNCFIMVAMFTILAGFIYAREYQENTINTTFTYPISRVKVFVSKLMVMLIIISVTCVFSFVLAICLGLSAKHEALTVSVFLKYLKAHLFMIIMHFALIPIDAFLSIYNKTINSIIILAIGVVSLNIILINTHLSTIFPWCIPAILSPHINGRTHTNYTLGIINICIIFIVGILLSIKSIKEDVY